MRSNLDVFLCHPWKDQEEKQSLDVRLSQRNRHYKLEDADGGRKVMVTVEVLMVTSTLDEVVWEWRRWGCCGWRCGYGGGDDNGDYGDDDGGDDEYDSNTDNKTENNKYSSRNSKILEMTWV